MAEICCIAFDAWEMIHGSAAVVIDCYFRKVVVDGLQDSVIVYATSVMFFLFIGLNSN